MTGTETEKGASLGSLGYPVMGGSFGWDVRYELWAGAWGCDSIVRCTLRFPCLADAVVVICQGLY